MLEHTDRMAAGAARAWEATPEGKALREKTSAEEKASREAREAQEGNLPHKGK
jgi:hypothetical protein